MEVAIDRRLGRDLMWFVLDDMDFYEDPAATHSRSKEYRTMLDRLVPSTWMVGIGGVWLHALPSGAEIPLQGFKIHVSGTSVTAEELLRKVVPVCIKNEAAFKVVADPLMLERTTAKNHSRGASGKFITIYPANDEHFVTLLNALDLATSGMSGPYVLSDKRYGENRVLFYRYGGFAARFQLNIYGEQVPMISTPDGRLVPDHRTPFFELPEGIKDPFESGNPEVEDKVCLKGRYLVTDLIVHSNAGGIYKGEDLETGRAIIIKEARPLINVTRAGGPDATVILRKEASALEKLAHTGYSPQPLDFFQEWEHYFLVEEFLPGIPISSYRARPEAMLIQRRPTEDGVQLFCGRLCRIAESLILALQAFHAAGVVMGDLSPENILIDPETLSVRIIDFEGAFIIGEDTPDTGLYTAGFLSPDRPSGATLSPQDDFYALGAVLYNLILPVQPLFALDPDARERFIDELSRDYRLPPAIKEIIFALFRGDAHRSQAIVESIDSVRPALPPAVEPAPPDRRRIAKTLDGISDYILAKADPKRKDRLWPCDYRLFSTNPLSVAYGAIGTALFLKLVSGSVPQEILDWIDRQPLSLESYAPGVYVGLAGIAWGLEELGLTQKAAVAIDLALQSPLLSQSSDIFLGAAGVGLSCLNFFRQSGEARFLERARRLGDAVIERASRHQNGYYWSNVDGITYFGHCHGASGIGLFLLYLHLETGDARYLLYARGAVDYEIARGRINDEDAAWNRAEGDSMEVPYWRFGSSGIGSVLVRFAAILGDSRYRTVAEKAANHAATKYAVFPGQLLGLSGIGEFLLDLYRFTGREKYLTEAFRIADGVTLFQIQRPEGIAFPGEELLRISTDYGTGSAGVGMFLHRLLEPAGRLFYDPVVQRRGQELAVSGGARFDCSSGR